MLMWEKSEEQLCPEVHFRRTSEGIRITGCYGTDGELVLPDEIEGEMVTEIGDYAFAQREQAQDEEIWLSPCADLVSDRHKICGSEVTMVWLPVKVREIGRYAFYRCRNLKKLILTDSLPEIGGGLGRAIRNFKRASSEPDEIDITPGRDKQQASSSDDESRKA